MMTPSIHPLYQFFLDRFTTADLRRLVALNYPELTSQLPGKAISLSELAMAVATGLQREDAIDEDLFVLLERERPRLKASVDQLRQHFIGPATGAGPRAPSLGGPGVGLPAALAQGAAQKRLRVMFVAANPAALPELQLAEEAKRIEDKLRGTPAEQRIDFDWHWSAGPESLVDMFFPNPPDVLHFAGHGTASGGLMVQTADGRAHPVAPEAFAELISVRPRRPRVIFLNACFSAVMARAISPFIDAVVGMRGEVEDRAARQFAVEFYRALAHGDAIKPAFDTARAALRVYNLSSDQLPQLSMRGELDPRNYCLL